MNLSPDQQVAYGAIVHGKKTIYLTGEAGAGKTFLVNYAVEALIAQGRSVYKSAPTGIAASHIEGTTVYRTFGILPSDGESILRRKFKKPEHLEPDSVFVIDEVSMLRADLLHLINRRLREWGDEKLVFGGFQVVFVGDWAQLPPVVKPQDMDLVKEFTDGKPAGFAFYSPLWQHVRPIILTTVHRQATDQDKFKRILNDVRANTVTERHVR